MNTIVFLRNLVINTFLASYKLSVMTNVGYQDNKGKINLVTTLISWISDLI